MNGAALRFKTGDAPAGSMSIAAGTTLDFVSGDIWNHGTVSGEGRLLWESGVLNGELTVGQGATLPLMRRCLMAGRTCFIIHLPIAEAANGKALSDESSDRP